MSESGHNITPSFGEASALHEELFEIVGKRYGEAYLEQSLNPEAVYLETEEVDGMPTAQFQVVSNFEAFSEGRAHIIKVRVPLDELGDFISGISLLGSHNLDGNVHLRILRPKHHDREVDITNDGVFPTEGYPWLEIHRKRLNEEHAAELKHDLDHFMLMNTRPPQSSYSPPEAN